MIYIPHIYVVNGSNIVKASDHYLSENGIFPQYLVDGNTASVTSLPPPGVTEIKVNMVLPRSIWTKLAVVVTLVESIDWHPHNIHMTSYGDNNSTSNMCVSQCIKNSIQCHFLCQCPDHCDYVQMFIKDISVDINDITFCSRCV